MDITLFSIKHGGGGTSIAAHKECSSYFKRRLPMSIDLLLGSLIGNLSSWFNASLSTQNLSFSRCLWIFSIISMVILLLLKFALLFVGERDLDLRQICLLFLSNVTSASPALAQVKKFPSFVESKGKQNPVLVCWRYVKQSIGFYKDLCTSIQYLLHRSPQWCTG